MSWEPRFTLEARTARALMRIEGARAAIEGLPVSPQLLASLRQSARLLATHYSTQIEGNQLTPEQVVAVAAGGAAMPGRERDAAEVRHYLLALEEMERLAAQGGELTGGRSADSTVWCCTVSRGPLPGGMVRSHPSSVISVRASLTQSLLPFKDWSGCRVCGVLEGQQF